MNFGTSVMIRFVLAFVVVMFTQVELVAQTFKASVVAGLNASQIDGDDLWGYNKFGFEGGLHVDVSLSEKFSVAMELLYSQRGSRNKIIKDVPTEPVRINLNYAAIPIFATYRDWKMENQGEEAYYKFQFYGGFGYGRLVQGSTTGVLSSNPNIEDPLAEAFNKNDLSLHLGFIFFASQHIGVGASYNRSLLRVFDSTLHPDINANSLISHWLNFKIYYQF